MVLIMKKSFEEYITFIENELGVKLLCWQKMALEAIYKGHCPYISGVRCGKVIMERAAEMLKEEMDLDMGNLPPRLYELDGYTGDIVMCYEHQDDRNEWEKRID